MFNLIRYLPLSIAIVGLGFSQLVAAGPGSGTGNNTSLGNFYLVGNLSMKALKNRVAYMPETFTTPDYRKLSIGPILKKWQEFSSEKIKVHAVFNPIYDTHGRRTAVKTDSAKLTELDWNYSEFDPFDERFPVLESYVFRAILGQLAAENPEYEDVDRGLSNILAKWVRDSVDKQIPDLPFYNVELNDSNGGDVQAGKIYGALRENGLIPQKMDTLGSTDIADADTKLIEINLLRCVHDPRGNYECFSFANPYNDARSARNAVNSRGTQAQALFSALTMAGSPVLVTEGGTRVSLFHLLCKEIYRSAHQCKIQQTPRVWPAIFGYSRPLSYDRYINFDNLSSIRTLGHQASRELEKGHLVREDGTPIDVSPLIEKWHEIETGAIRLETTDRPLFDAEGAPVDVETYADKKLTVIYMKVFDGRLSSALRMVYHELCRHLEKEHPEYRDVGYRLSQALTNQTLVAVSTRVSIKLVKETVDSGPNSIRLFDMLLKAGVKPGKNNTVEVTDFTCEDNHYHNEQNLVTKTSLVCYSSGPANENVHAHGPAAGNFIEVLGDLGFEEASGEDQDSIMVNQISCARTIGSRATSCRIQLYPNL